MDQYQRTDSNEEQEDEVVTMRYANQPTEGFWRMWDAVYGHQDDEEEEEFTRYGDGENSELDIVTLEITVIMIDLDN
jgi:hypothetical protein